MTSPDEVLVAAPSGASDQPAASTGPAPAAAAWESAAATLVPPWLVNLAALAWRLVAITLLVAAGWYISSTITVVTAAIAVSVVVTAVLVPAIRLLRRRGRSRSAAAAIVWAASLAAILLLALVLAAAFLPHILPMLEAIQAGFADLQARLASLNVPPVVSAIIGTVLGLAISLVGSVGSEVASTAASIGTSLVLATFLVFFLLRDGDRAWLWSLQAMPEEKRDRLTAAGEQALTRVAGYLIGTTVLSALIAATDLVFMVLLGVPLALPLSLLVFLAGYIPYFGGIITTLIVLLVTFSAVGPTAALVMIVLIGIRNVVMAYAVRPTVYGKSVNLHPALVLIALPAGYEVAGVIGLFAAVPLLAVVLTVASAVVDAVEPERAPALPGLVPPWLDRIAQWSWRLLAVLALTGLAVGLVVNVPLVFLPIVLGVILAATFAPIVTWLRNRGWSRGRAIALTLGGSFVVIAVLLALAVGVLAEQAAPMASATQAGATRIDQAAGGNLGLVVQGVVTISQTGLAQIRELVSQLALATVVTVLSGLLCFYFLRDGDRLWARFLGRMPREHEADIQSTGTRAFEVMGGYMYGTAAISFVGALSQFVIMVILGVPLALPVFVLSFFLCFIPYIGGFLSTGVALVLTIGTGSDTAILVMVIWTLVFNIVTGNVVSPIVYGKTVHLHPAIVLVSIPIGSAVAGILGMLLVVPALGVVAVSWRTVLRVIAGNDGPDEGLAGDGAAVGLPSDEPPTAEPGPAGAPAG